MSDVSTSPAKELLALPAMAGSRGLAPASLAPESPDGARRILASRLLIVIPTLDEAAHIETLLQTLLSERQSFALMRIVVADGGSNDGTQRLVEAIGAQHVGVHVIHNPAKIQSAGINLAVRTFGDDADVLLRCDAHSLYPAGYCRALVDTLQRTKADAVVVPMDSVGRRCLQRATALVSNSPVGTGGSAHRGGRRSGFVDHGHHAAFRLEMFRRVGGYDEAFSHNEDAELDCRQRSLGATIYLDAGIRVRYQVRDSLTSLWRQYFNYGAGRSRTIRRHPRSVRLRQMAVPLNMIGLVVTLVLGPRFPALLAWPLLYVAALVATSVYLAVRHREPCCLLAGLAAAVMHAAWASGFLVCLVTRRERAWSAAMAAPISPGVRP